MGHNVTANITKRGVIRRISLRAETLGESKGSIEFAFQSLQKLVRARQTKAWYLPVQLARGSIITLLLYQMQDILQIPYKTLLSTAIIDDWLTICKHFDRKPTPATYALLNIPSASPRLGVRLSLLLVFAVTVAAG